MPSRYIAKNVDLPNKQVFWKEKRRKHNHFSKMTLTKDEIEDDTNPENTATVILLFFGQIQSKYAGMARKFPPFLDNNSSSNNKDLAQRPPPEDLYRYIPKLTLLCGTCSLSQSIHVLVGELKSKDIHIGSNVR